MESGAKGPSGRVRLRALDTSVEPTAPAAAAPSWIKDKTSRPASTLSSNSKGEEDTPDAMKTYRACSYWLFCLMDFLCLFTIVLCRFVRYQTAFVGP